MWPVAVCLVAHLLPIKSSQAVTAENAAIKVEFQSPPGAQVGWIDEGNNLVVVYAGDLRQPDGSPTIFDLTLNFSAKGNHKLLDVNAAAVPAPGTAHTVNNVEVSATAPTVISFTVEDTNEQKVPGTITFVAVEMKIHGTTRPEDRLVVVSGRVDEDLATDVSFLTNGQDLTVDLADKGNPANLTFKDDTLPLQQGVEAGTKMWGSQPSAVVNGTTLVGEIKKGDKSILVIEENLTVFKGVKIEFAGNYYINVDTRDFGRRPWDNRPDPKAPDTHNAPLVGANGDSWLAAYAAPADRAILTAAVDQSETFGYQSAVSFKSGDNPAVPLYKPWIDPLEVKVTRVLAKEPDFELTSEALVGAVLEMKQGHLEGPDANEDLVDPVILVGDFFALRDTGQNTRIEAAGALPVAPVTAADIRAQIAAEFGKGYNELLTILRDGLPNVDLPAGLAFFSNRIFSWKNDSFRVEAGNHGLESVAVKALLSALEAGDKIEAGWRFTEWNEFKFQGQLDQAAIETK